MLSSLTVALRSAIGATVQYILAPTRQITGLAWKRTINPRQDFTLQSFCSGHGFFVQEDATSPSVEYPREASPSLEGLLELQIGSCGSVRESQIVFWRFCTCNSPDGGGFVGTYMQ